MLIRSATASPNIHAFHYAPARSPRQSPSRTSVDATARRPASSSSPLSPAPAGAPTAALPPVSSPLSQSLAAAAAASPLQPSRTPPRRYVSADAATQYSPMEPFDYAAHPRRYASTESTPREIPPTPGPVPMEPGIEQGVDNSGGQADGASDQPSQPGQTQPDHQPRREPGPLVPPSSASASTIVGDASAATQTPQTPQTSSLPLQQQPRQQPQQPQQPQPPQSQPQQPQQPQPSRQQQPQSSSPNKRRSSQDSDPQGSSNGEGPASVKSVVYSPSMGPKRVKAEATAKILPERYELCAVEDMVALIANMLSELIETNDALALKSGHLTRFHSRTAPGISVLDYLHRLAKHATLTPPLLLSMVYYIDRLCAMYPDFTINTLTVHRFLITAATVAAKGLSDSFWNNSTYARVGGVRVAELKMLELEFLYRLEWKIVPNPEVLAAYYRPLVERCPGYVLPASSSDELAAATATATATGSDGVAEGSTSSGYDDGRSPSSSNDSSGKGTSNNTSTSVVDGQSSSTNLIGRDMVVSGPGLAKNGCS